MGIILASGSLHRRRMLEKAGIAFTVEASTLDERALAAPLEESGLGPDDIATVLAEAKAVDVSERRPGALVIGADQTLAFGDEVLHKPADMEDARRTLLKLSGRTHRLNSAVVLAEDGVAVWRHLATADMTLRRLDPGFVGRYLAGVGDKVLSSVGAYQIEAEGIQLMDRIEGDLFTVVGLPLLPLVQELRRRGAIDG